MGGGEQVPAVADLFRKGSAFRVWREICWRSASARQEQKRVSVPPAAPRCNQRAAGAVLRRLFLESGTSHSGEAKSFSPSEPLLWPGSGTELLDSSLTKREGRASSSFPSTVRSNASETRSGGGADLGDPSRHSRLCLGMGLGFGMLARG